MKKQVIILKKIKNFKIMLTNVNHDDIFIDVYAVCFLGD